MSIKTKDFFKENIITDSTYELSPAFIDGAISMADSMVCASSLGVYVFDYTKRAVVYVSPNIASWCNIQPSDITTNGCDAYLKYINEEDLQMLLEINQAVFNFLKKFPDDESASYTVSYDFRYGQLMVNQHYKPVAVKDGNVMMAVCVVSLSSSKESGNIIMDSPKSKCAYEYSTKLKKWIKKKKIHLTDKEKEIIRLSVQGLNTTQIAEATHKKEDTIKSQKKNLFHKLSVHSMAEAIRMASNNKLM
ncbi:MAG: helix-turn-helix transcriptional regulator [Bacteroidales bacterium]|nr:helix-turn-helix transcriptional regulator [Bacteroidales bacterium]